MSFSPMRPPLSASTGLWAAARRRLARQAGLRHSISDRGITSYFDTPLYGRDKTVDGDGHAFHMWGGDRHESAAGIQRSRVTALLFQAMAQPRLPPPVFPGPGTCVSATTCFSRPCHSRDCHHLLFQVLAPLLPPRSVFFKPLHVRHCHSLFFQALAPLPPPRSVFSSPGTSVSATACFSRPCHGHSLFFQALAPLLPPQPVFSGPGTSVSATACFSRLCHSRLCHQDRKSVV